MLPSISVFHCRLSVAFLIQVVPSFSVMSSCHLLLGHPLDFFPLLGCHSVQHLVHLLSFILAVWRPISTFVSVCTLWCQLSLFFSWFLSLVLQPKMFSSCDALPYHWNPTSMAERVELPLCNGSPTLNIFTHRFSVPPISPVSKSCGDGGVAKRQVEMRLTDHPSCGRFTKNQQKKLLVGAWNVRTLLDRDNTARPERRTALIAKELARYRIDIAALSETRLADEGILKEDGGGYTFFWRGKPEAEDRLHGVGFAIRTSLMKSVPSLPVGINERLMKLRLPLTKSRHLTIVVPTPPPLPTPTKQRKSSMKTLTNW